MTTNNNTQGRHTATRTLIASISAKFAASQERRSARAAERSFREEINHFSSPSQINDILAALATRDDAQSRNMRDVLALNLQHQV